MKSPNIRFVMLFALLLFLSALAGCANQGEESLSALDSPSASEHDGSSASSEAQSSDTSSSNRTPESQSSTSESGASDPPSSSSASESPSASASGSSSSASSAAEEPATMHVTGIDDTRVHFVITNHTPYEGTSGPTFDLEYYEDSEWVAIPALDDMIPGSLMLFDPASSRECVILMDSYDYQQRHGEYRIRKEIEINKETVSLSCTFRYE